MFFKNRLKEIEEAILDKQKADIADGESFGNSANVRRVKREAEISALNLKRQFILDKRNGWKPKILWDVLVPITVALITSYIVAKFISG